MDALYNALGVAPQDRKAAPGVVARQFALTHNAYVGKYTDTTIIRGLQRADQGPRLLAARRAANLTQEQVAARIGVPPTTYQAWEQGRRSVTIDSAVVLSELYQVAGEWFLGSMSALEARMIGAARGLRGQIHEPEPNSHEVAPEKPHRGRRRDKGR